MSLNDYLEQNEMVPNHVKKSILLDVSNGLLYLQTQTPAILHRDINADNVLLTSSLQAKIADFGVSRIFEPDPAKYYMKMSLVLEISCICHLKHYNLITRKLEMTVISLMSSHLVFSYFMSIHKNCQDQLVHLMNIRNQGMRYNDDSTY